VAPPGNQAANRENKLRPNHREKPVYSPPRSYDPGATVTDEMVQEYFEHHRDPSNADTGNVILE